MDRRVAAQRKHDALRHFDNDTPRNSIAQQIAQNRAWLVQQLLDVAASLGDPDAGWTPDQKRALRDAAQRVVNAAR